ncbi:MAG: hypothetical protein K1X55_01075 [Chitinophagales bacterium]|nr:hypothetical protein [Chitinophagales bacterium]
MKKLLSVAVLFAMCLLTQAQTVKPQGDPQKVEALKISFITNKLSLTPEEAKLFWPIYNQYEEEKKALRKATFGEKDDIKNIDEMTDAEAQKFIDNQIAFKSKELDLNKKYIAEFKKVLPVKKVAKLLMVEEHFKKMLLEKAKENGSPQQPGPPQAPKPGTKPAPKGE